MNHWATIALLAKLDQAAQRDLCGLASQMNFVDAGRDVLLAKRLTNLASGKFLQSMLKFHRSTKTPPEFPNLLQRCQHESRVLYTKDTVAEFHGLLVATLVAYAATLQSMFMLTREQEVAEKKYRAEEKSRAEGEKAGGEGKEKGGKASGEGKEKGGACGATA